MRDIFLGVPSILTTIYRLQFEGSCLKTKSNHLRRHITETTKYLHGSISASIRGIFLKLHPCQYSRIAYKIPQFICHRPIMKSTYFGNVSRLHFERIFCISTTSISCKLLVLNCNRPIMKGTLLVEENTFTAMSRLPLERLSSKSTPNTPSILPTKDCSLVAIGQ